MKFCASLVLTLVMTQAAWAKDCKKGKPCGNTCIPTTSECAADKVTKKECKKGKPCGNTCISEKATCSIK